MFGELRNSLSFPASKTCPAASGKLLSMKRLLVNLCLFALLPGGLFSGCTTAGPGAESQAGAAAGPEGIEVRGIYGGVPGEGGSGESIRDLGVNAVWIGSRSFTHERVELVKAQGARMFAEFNTMHYAPFLEDHPNAAPVGIDGKVSPPPHDWQGICPTHEGYRQDRMRKFRELAREFELDGIWLDYHHSHASWEREDPVMPDTCFCERCLASFESDTGLEIPDGPAGEKASLIMAEHQDEWVQWRCDIFTDWVREFREILDEERPGALLGTFHNPWSDKDYDGARIRKLAIDLKAQAEYIDVFSPMPYHARFGYADDPGWIARQVSWLGSYLGVEGVPGEEIQIWPIAQLSDWGQPVPPSQVSEVMEAAAQPPSRGMMVFAWGRLREQPEKVEELKKFYRGMTSRE